MPTVHSGLSSFFASFPFPLFLALGVMISIGLKKPRSSRLSRTLMAGCGIGICAIVVFVWHFQAQWLREEAQTQAIISVPYLEQGGVPSSQAPHYHYAELAGLHGFKVLHYQMLWQMVWFGAFFLILLVLLYWSDRRQLRVLQA